MLAVIKTGGKQYLVAPGKKIKIEKLEAEEGQDVVFDDVLLLDKGAGASTKATAPEVEIGQPKVETAKVSGKVLKQGRAPKITVFKYKPKKRYKVKKGHRQFFTEVEITEIL